MTSSKSNYVWAVVSGLLLTTAFPKINFSWCAWFALIPLFTAMRDATPGQGFRLAMTTGMTHYIGLLYWLVHTMHVYGYLPVYQSVIILFLMSIILSIFIGIFGWLTATIDSPKHLWLIPVFWTALEYIRTYIFTGFPWEFLGHSQYQHLWVIQIADLIGVYGISFLIVTINVALFACFASFFKYRWKHLPIKIRITGAYLLAGGILLTATLIYGQKRIVTIDGTLKSAPKVNIALVQGNIDQSIKWESSFQNFTIKRYQRLSRTSLPEKPDLIVWPETATPFYFNYDKKLTQRVINGIKRAKTPFLIGSPSVIVKHDDVRYYNSAYLINKDGVTIDKYDKVHLVPFGEYVPLKKYFPFIGKMVEQIGDFRAGVKGGVLKWQKANLGVQICYEIIFPDLARAMVKNGADLLINITNDAWFGATSAAYQHFSMAVFRSVENKRALARSANTGISGFVDPVGRILATTPIYEENVLTRPCSVLKENTIYTRFGDFFAQACLTLMIIIVTTKGIRKTIKCIKQKRTQSI